MTTPARLPPPVPHVAPWGFSPIPPYPHSP